MKPTTEFCTPTSTDNDGAPLFLRRKDAAEYLRSRYGVGSVVWLATRALHGDGPRFHRLGSRVLYAPSELDGWMQARLSGPLHSTSVKDPRKAKSPGRPRKDALRSSSKVAGGA